VKNKPQPPIKPGQQFTRRSWVVVGLLVVLAVGVLGRAIDLQVLKHGFLTEQGTERFMRVIKMPAHRGNIVDRFGEAIAVSTPVYSVFVNPSIVTQNPENLAVLAQATQRDQEALTRRISSNLDTNYLVVARHVQPDDAEKLESLKLPGVSQERAYQRYYPAGEVTGHVLGFTGNEDQGQEGLELGFESRLAGEDGQRRVIINRMGQKVETIESIKAPRAGQELVTSIDLRMQYLAYRELKAAVQEYKAKSGSIVIIDVRTGEILAMVNQPSFNPNDKSHLEGQVYRNRAALDVLEPGSTMKPFFVLAGLASGKLKNDEVIDTNPGFIRVGLNTIEDEHNLGRVDVSTILAKSSNVGMAHIALRLDHQFLYNTLTGFGFGKLTPAGFPGESAGVLPTPTNWHEVWVATAAHGYGLSVTPLQLAQAYATIGAYGVRRPVTLLRVDSAPPGTQVVNPQICRDVISMLENVVTMQGATGHLASIRGYRVAGKTGTAWKNEHGSYQGGKYEALFAGLVPATAPRLAAVVVIDEPSNGKYYGGDVAAPVFSSVMGGALRLMAIPPDDLERLPSTTLVQAVQR
jgi:cell division protein FtsI (penicillin-binding protein 3)